MRETTEIARVREREREREFDNRCTNIFKNRCTIVSQTMVLDRKSDLHVGISLQSMFDKLQCPGQPCTEQGEPESLAEQAQAPPDAGIV